jgi:hypothetical protein
MIITTIFLFAGILMTATGGVGVGVLFSRR